MSGLADILRTIGQAASLMQYRIDAQLHQARRHVNSVLTYLGFLVVGLLLMLAGFGFLLWGCWSLLAVALNPGAAALIVGGVLIVFSILFLVVVRSAAGPQ